MLPAPAFAVPTWVLYPAQAPTPPPQLNPLLSAEYGTMEAERRQSRRETEVNILILFSDAARSPLGARAAQHCDGVVGTSGVRVRPDG